MDPLRVVVFLAQGAAGFLIPIGLFRLGMWLDEVRVFDPAGPHPFLHVAIRMFTRTVVIVTAVALWRLSGRDGWAGLRLGIWVLLVYVLVLILRAVGLVHTAALPGAR